MALEKSVLNEHIICHLLKQYYGVTFVSMQKLKLGTANCYQVYNGNQYYFLKEFQSSFSANTVVQEAKLLEFLRASGIPTTRFYKTLGGEYVVDYQSHMICLEEFIEGQSYDYDDLPSDLLPAVGRMLGKLHHALKDYPLPIDMSDTWLASFSTDKLIEQYDTLIKVAKVNQMIKMLLRLLMICSTKSS